MGAFTFGGEGPFGMVGNQGVTAARRLVDLCIDHGVNLLYTANMYSTGRAEEILGDVLEGRYDDILVTSKARMRIGTQQIHYTLEARGSEYELLPLSVDQGLGCAGVEPLGGGAAHRQAPARRGTGGRIPSGRGLERAANSRHGTVVVHRRRACRDCGGTWRVTGTGRVGKAAQASRHHLVRRRRSNRGAGQGNFGAVDLRLSDEGLGRLNDVSRRPLICPYRHQHNFARPRFVAADQALHTDYPDRYYGGNDPLL
jgi:hypothetical protein